MSGLAVADEAGGDRDELEAAVEGLRPGFRLDRGGDRRKRLLHRVEVGARRNAAEHLHVDGLVARESAAGPAGSRPRATAVDGKE